jgi:hypothetical protein
MDGYSVGVSTIKACPLQIKWTTAKRGQRCRGKTTLGLPSFGETLCPLNEPQAEQAAVLSCAKEIKEGQEIRREHDQARRIGHATFETPDLDRAIAYFTDVNTRRRRVAPSWQARSGFSPYRWSKVVRGV